VGLPDRLRLNVTDGGDDHIDPVSPVRLIPGDDQREPDDGVALCLSGGGYRAMLFHLGAVWRLNDLGLLPSIDRISSVSGGSITAGVLATRWQSLGFSDGVAQNFRSAVVEPTLSMARRTIDLPSVIRGVLIPRHSIADAAAAAYDRHLLAGATLQDLPDRPRFVFNAANLQSGVLFRFSKPYVWDYRVGEIERPTMKVAIAVAASAGFPPFLSPLTLRFDPRAFVAGSGTDLEQDGFRRRVRLADGGVYDNLGLETAWKRYRTVLVSDGGGKMGAQAKPHLDWPRQTYRVLDMIDNQVRSLRKRQVIASFQRPEADRDHRKGAYWGIRSDIDNYSAPGTLACSSEKVDPLAHTATRLARLPDAHQKGLTNWGYAICDAAVRAHVDRALPPPSGCPFPEVPLS
jgi:NTE family protein